MRRSVALLAALAAGVLAGCHVAPPSAVGAARAAPRARAPGAADACCPCEIAPWPVPPRRTTYVAGSFSFLPNLGVGLRAGRVFQRSSMAVWSAEVGGVLQFLDDEAFVDDGKPAAGDWYQAQAGIKASFAPSSRRHLTLRAGAVWFQANGEPNIVDTPGDYFGVYGGVGFETDVTPSLTVGPELSLLLATRTAEFNARPVPQFAWRATWWLDGRRCGERAPLGEVYVGGTGSLSPGLGGGFLAGQVFERSRLATWSFELLAGFQDPSDSLYFDGEGRWGQVRGGGKMTLSPRARGHATARAGLVWLRSTAANEFLTGTPGDYVGGYAGLGYEFDLGRRIHTGPEIAVLFVAKESSATLELVPQVHWHVILDL